MTPVTPSKKGRHTLRAFSFAACDAVTPMTPLSTQAGVRTRARACVYIHVSYVSYSHKIHNIKGLSI